MLERTILFAKGDRIERADLQLTPSGAPEPRARPSERVAAAADHRRRRRRLPAEVSGSLKDAVRAETARVERELIVKALDETGGNVTQAARLLKISAQEPADEDEGVRPARSRVVVRWQAPGDPDRHRLRDVRARRAREPRRAMSRPASTPRAAGSTRSGRSTTSTSRTRRTSGASTSAIPAPIPNAPLPTQRDLAFHQSRHTITPRLDIGLYHDTWISVALPVIIDQSRQLRLDNGVDRERRRRPCQTAFLPATGFDAQNNGAPRRRAT